MLPVIVPSRTVIGMKTRQSTAGRVTSRLVLGGVGLVLLAWLVGRGLHSGATSGQEPPAAAPSEEEFVAASILGAHTDVELARSALDPWPKEPDAAFRKTESFHPEPGAWFPTPPDRDLGGMVSSEVLAAYYGSELQAALADMGTLADKLYEMDSWVRPTGHRLGEAGTSLEAIKRMMIERCDKKNLLFSTVFDDGWTPQAIYSITDFSGSLARALGDHAIANGKPKAHLPFPKQRESQARIEELRLPRDLLIDELVKEVRAAVARDLEPVSLTQKPAVGSMHVGAALNWVTRSVRERREQNPSRWWFTTIGQGGPRSSYLGHYIALATDFPECNAVIQQILVLENQLEAALAAEKQWWLDNCEWKDA